MWLLDLLPWSAQLREKSKRKAGNPLWQWLSTHSEFAHGRLPPEMNQLLRVPLRQRYVLILGGGDSPDPFSIPRWNSTQETPRGSVYELIVEETERMTARKSYTIPGTRRKVATAEQAPSPRGILSLSTSSWLASWSNNCQPNYNDSLKSPSRSPGLKVSSYLLEPSSTKKWCEGSMRSETAQATAIN